MLTVAVKLFLFNVEVVSAWSTLDSLMELFPCTRRPLAVGPSTANLSIDFVTTVYAAIHERSESLFGASIQNDIKTKPKAAS